MNNFLLKYVSSMRINFVVHHLTVCAVAVVQVKGKYTI